MQVNARHDGRAVPLRRFARAMRRASRLRVAFGARGSWGPMVTGRGTSRFGHDGNRNHGWLHSKSQLLWIPPVCFGAEDGALCQVRIKGLARWPKLETLCALRQIPLRLCQPCWPGAVGSWE